MGNIMGLILGILAKLNINHKRSIKHPFLLISYDMYSKDLSKNYVKTMRKNNNNKSFVNKQTKLDKKQDKRYT